MKEGFKNELELRKTAIQNCRVKLEGLYGVRVEDEDINKPEHAEHKGNILSAIRSTETAFNALAGSIKSVKAVVDPSPEISGHYIYFFLLLFVFQPSACIYIYIYIYMCVWDVFLSMMLYVFIYIYLIYI